jgi:predicted AAA+ superfamily ATPase
MIKKQIIYREGYFRQIEPYIGDNLIKVLIGQRRVGKSYILLQLMEEIKKRLPGAEIIYINKEDYAFDSIKNYIDLMSWLQSVRKSGEKTYLFIDEVQDIVDFEKALRSLHSGGDYDIYCTGSNAKLLSGELATFLAGRYIKIRVFALTYIEFLQFHQLPDNSGSLMKYIQVGGLPHLINLKNEERVYYEYLRNVFDTIVLRDVVARYKVRNVSFLQDLIHFLADNIGSVVSAKKISDYLKSQRISLLPKSILEYIFYLESVFFIERVKIGDKFYFEDLGMRHALVPFQQKDIGKVLENLVFHHLRAIGFNVFVGRIDNREIDFVADKDGKKWYIQVTYLIPDEQTHEREFGNLLRIDDNYPKMVISMDELTGSNFKGIEHWNIRKFLTEFKG